MYRFRECRVAAGIQQKTAALELGIAAPSVSDWENGRTNPTLENLVKMAALYRTTTDALLGLEGNAVFADGPEADLLELFRQLNTAGRAALLAAAEGMLSTPGLRQAASIASMG